MTTPTPFGDDIPTTLEVKVDELFHRHRFEEMTKDVVLTWAREVCSEMYLFVRDARTGVIKGETRNMELRAELLVLREVLHKTEEARDHMRDRAAGLAKERDDLKVTLADVLSQACRQDGPAVLRGDNDEKIEVGVHYDSMALSSYAGGLRHLAALGVIRIVTEYGRRVLAVDLEPHRSTDHCPDCNHAGEGNRG